MDDVDRILVQARRIGLSLTELEELTPKDFKAFNKGYQLSLADQRQQILYGHAVPQLTVSSIEANQDALSEAFQKLSDRDKEQMERMLNDGNADQSKLTAGNRLFIEAMKRIGKG